MAAALEGGLESSSGFLETAVPQTTPPHTHAHMHARTHPFGLLQELGSGASQHFVCYAL